MESVVKPSTINILSRPPQPAPIQGAIPTEEVEPAKTWWSKFKDGLKKAWSVVKEVVETVTHLLASTAAFLTAYSKLIDFRNDFRSQKQKSLSCAG